MYNVFIPKCSTPSVCVRVMVIYTVQFPPIHRKVFIHIYNQLNGMITSLYFPPLEIRIDNEPVPLPSRLSCRP